MKTAPLVILTVLLATPCLSQIRENKYRELSLSGGYQNISRSGSSSNSSLLLISPRLGFFVNGGLEIEPEAILMVGSGIDVVYMINGNIAYNFSAGPNGVPFLLAGYGVSNTVPVFDVPVTKTAFAVGVLNLGAGMKIFLNDEVAFRVEYRFQNFSGEGDAVAYPGYSYTPKVDYTVHTAQFGFSILL
jgi:opacity protein-like surface antigen